MREWLLGGRGREGVGGKGREGRDRELEELGVGGSWRQGKGREGHGVRGVGCGMESVAREKGISKFAKYINFMSNNLDLTDMHN